MGLRRRSIRLRIFFLVLIPLLSLLGLYIFVASITIGDALSEAHARALKNDTGTPVGNSEGQTAPERRAPWTYPAGPRPHFLQRLTAQKTNPTRAPWAPSQT